MKEIPEDVREQIVEIHSRETRPFTETHYLTAQVKREVMSHWLFELIDKGHK